MFLKNENRFGKSQPVGPTAPGPHRLDSQSLRSRDLFSRRQDLQVRVDRFCLCYKLISSRGDSRIIFEKIRSNFPDPVQVFT